MMAIDRPRLCLSTRSSGAESATGAQRERAVARLAACDRSNGLHASGMPRDEADRTAAAEAGVSVQSLRRWRSLVSSRSGTESRVDALIDRPGRGRPRREWSDGEDRLYSLFASDYLRAEAPDAAACHRRLIPVAESAGITLPGVSTFMVRLRSETDRSLRTRARSGAMKYLETLPHVERTVRDLGPLAVVDGDGRRHDVVVEFPSGRIGRPCVWAWQDVWSRKFLAWRAGETESADLVRTSLHEVIIVHGVPDRLLTDSTRAVSAKWLTGGQKNRKRWRSTDEELPGLLRILDIEFSATQVDADSAGRGQGRGRAKPIERAFLDLSRQIDTHPRLEGAYTGRSVDDRPETHRSKPASWETFLEVVHDCVIEHNSRTGRQTEIAAGRSFDEAWNEGIANAVIRRITPAQASILLLAAEDVLVGRDATFHLKCGRGSGLPANRYHSTQLLELAGQRVVARFDPSRLHEAAHVYDADGRWLCEAECLMPVGFADSESAREYERSRRSKRKAVERSLRATRDMDSLLDALGNAPAPEPDAAAEPAAVRLVTGDGIPDAPGRRKHARSGQSAAISAAVSLYRREDDS